ncbi:MAG: META domain-containing protein [Bacteroidia bacterium]
MRILIALSLLFCSSCAIQPGTDPYALYNHNWISLTEDSEKPIASFKLLANGKFIGSDGCNRFNGQLNVGKKLEKAQLAGTKMLCQHGRDQAFWKAFEEHDNWRIRGDMLQLRKGKKVIWRFEREQLPEEAAETVSTDEEDN